MRWLGVFWLVVSCPAAQAQDHREDVISGTVIDAATGRPLPSAEVVVRVSYAHYGFRDRLTDRPRPADSGRAITDNSGKFSIPFDPDVPATALFVSREGFRSEDNRDIAVLNMRPAGARNILVRLIPQSIIQGRIVDGQGEPLPGIVVQAIREEIHEGARQYRHNFATAVSARNGEFRLTSLTAGSYRLQAAGNSSDLKRGYGPVYFPDASELRSAQTIRIVPGQTVAADFKLAAHPVYRIQGVLNIANPVRRVALRVIRGNEPLNLITAVNLGSHSFEVDGIPSGSYVVQAYTPDSFPPDYGEAPITVADADVSKIQIAMNPAMDVRGRIEFKGSKHPERYAFVLTEPLTSLPPMRVPPTSRAMMEPGGTFLLRNLLPGQYRLSVRMPPDCYVESILAGNVDVQQNGFTLSPGKAPELKISIRKGGGAIEGSVEGAAPNGVFPVLLVTKRGTAQTTSVLSASGGRFVAEGLAPGDYSLYALPAAQQIEYRNPDVLASLAEFATQVSVRDGDRQVVTLKAVPELF